MHACATNRLAKPVFRLWHIAAAEVIDTIDRPQLSISIIQNRPELSTVLNICSIFKNIYFKINLKNYNFYHSWMAR